MAVDFQTSRTKENLMKAFAGESQARNRYTIAAQMAEGSHLYSVAEIFRFTAGQERAHARRFYELLQKSGGGRIEVRAEYPVDAPGNLADMIAAAQQHEMEEAGEIYQAFGRTAREEGFLEAAAAFLQTAEVEKVHADRFAAVKKLVESNTYFQLGEEGAWMCLNCGHIHRGTKAPEVCPLCRYEKGYFLPLSLAPYTGKIVE